MNNHIEKVILDASALITVISEEPGFKTIEALLPKAIMSSVNVAEVAKFLFEKQLMDRLEIETLISQLLEEVIPFDLDQSFNNAELYQGTKQYGLSLGDRACIGLGMITGFTIYTTDKIWSKLSLPNVNIKLIR